MTNPPTPTAPSRRTIIIASAAALSVIVLIIITMYQMHESKFVYSENAEIKAPLISLSPSLPGVLKRIYVHEGEDVRASQTVAFVGDEGITARVDGLVVSTEENIGSQFQPGQPVVTMIAPSELRVVARIDEDKGLKDIYDGQRVIFTVDAFGSRQFEGTVESVSPTKIADDVVFSISDKRETKRFDVKIRFDAKEASFFRNGMSSRVWIVK